jgi:SAM-dependent methyltransferase
MSEYVIRGGVEGKRRLDLLARVLRPTTVEWLARAGVGPGMRCLDLGCGGGHVTADLARVTGPDGGVVGVDSDETILQLAREGVEDAGLANVELRAGDVLAWDEQSSFDVVYARFLVTHVPDPAGVVARMAAAARPGGVVILEDIDYDGVFCRPVSPAFERYRSIFMTLVRQRGGDPTIGPWLVGLLRGAGLGDPELRVVQPVHYRGEGKLGNYITMVNIADRAVADGLLAGQEAEGLLTELLTVTEDEDTVMGWPRIFQVAARRPPA